MCEDAKSHSVAFIVMCSFCSAPLIRDAADATLYWHMLKQELLSFNGVIYLTDIPVVVLLTKPDKVCSVTSEDISRIYTSNSIWAILSEASEKLGVSKSAILPVKNYDHELELDCRVDILGLYALRQMMRYMDSYFEDYIDQGDFD